MSRVTRSGRFLYSDPEDDDDEPCFVAFDNDGPCIDEEPNPQADDDAADRYQREIERNYP
jgi:hypothetical protein